jgi:tetratricopeptide (TPR) repeat protein
MMAAGVLAMACLAASPQTVVADRARAGGLARDGRTAEAMQIFEGIVAANPADVEARLWIGRLDLRLGRAGDAEAVFRAVLADHPADVDARIGLGNALLRRNAWQDALTVLHGAERDAGENADLFATLARAYRRAGDDRVALDYFRRALARSPDDPDVVAGYEDVARAYGHGITLEGFGQHVAPGSDSGVGTFAARVRVAPRFHPRAGACRRARAIPDTLAGGGVEWRAGRATIVS